MDITEFKDKQAAGTLTRREINKALAAAGLVMFTAPNVSRTAAAAEGEVLYFTWGGFNDPALYKSYEEKHGAPPSTPSTPTRTRHSRRFAPDSPPTWWGPAARWCPNGGTPA